MWNIDGNKVYFEIEEKHVFYLERVKDGFVFRVYDERSEKPIQLFYNKLADSQLGIYKNEG